MKLLSVAVVTLATAAAFAKSNNEYFFQPAGGQSALKVGYQMGSFKKEVDATTSSDTKYTNSDFLIDYGYGLSESTTLGVYTFSGSLKSEPSTGSSSTANGLGDIHLYYKGGMDIWHYGVDLGVNTAKSKTDNRSTGGLSLGANFGGLWAADAWNYGFNLSAAMPMERTYEGASTATSGKITGGTSVKLSGVGEYNYGMGFLGAELGYTSKMEETTKPDSGGESKTKAYSFVDLELYGTYDFNDMATGFLSYEMDMIPATEIDGGTKYKAYNTSIATIGARFTF